MAQAVWTVLPEVGCQGLKGGHGEGAVYKQHWGEAPRGWSQTSELLKHECLSPESEGPGKTWIRPGKTWTRRSLLCDKEGEEPEQREAGLPAQLLTLGSALPSLAAASSRAEKSEAVKPAS